MMLSKTFFSIVDIMNLQTLYRFFGVFFCFAISSLQGAEPTGEMIRVPMRYGNCVVYQIEVPPGPGSAQDIRQAIEAQTGITPSKFTVRGNYRYRQSDNSNDIEVLTVVNYSIQPGSVHVTGASTNVLVSDLARKIIMIAPEEDSRFPNTFECDFSKVPLVFHLGTDREVIVQNVAGSQRSLLSIFRSSYSYRPYETPTFSCSHCKLIIPSRTSARNCACWNFEMEGTAQYIQQEGELGGESSDTDDKHRHNLVRCKFLLRKINVTWENPRPTYQELFHRMQECQTCSVGILKSTPSALPGMSPDYNSSTESYSHNDLEDERPEGMPTCDTQSILPKNTPWNRSMLYGSTALNALLVGCQLWRFYQQRTRGNFVTLGLSTASLGAQSYVLCNLWKKQ